MIDGEEVALGESGKPSFNALQNHGSSSAPMLFYVFDLLILGGRDLMSEVLSARRDLLERSVLPKLRDPIREVPRGAARPHRLATHYPKKVKVTRLSLSVYEPTPKSASPSYRQ